MSEGTLFELPAIEERPSSGPTGPEQATGGASKAGAASVVTAGDKLTQ